MPGYGNWKTLFTLEHAQLRQEGYPVQAQRVYLPATTKNREE